jgi:hypothetical protein
MKNLLLSFMLLSLAISCTTFDDSSPTALYNGNLSAVKVENGIVTLPSKEYLNQIVNDYRKGVNQQNDFNRNIRKLQDGGFKPLTPCFFGLNEKQIEEFVTRKKERLNQRNIDFGLYNRDPRDFELNLDDEVIKDPVLAALLNEDREIVIADILYKYTELGLLFIDKDEKQTLLNYLDSKTPQEKFNLLTQYHNEFSTTNKPEEKIETLGSGLTSFRMLLVNHANVNPDEGGGDNGSGSGSGGGGSGGGSGSGGTDDGNLGGTNGTGVGTIGTPGSSSGTGSGNSWGDGVFNPTTFGNCTIENQGFFEGSIFGTTESCYEYYNDNRRVEVTFWNQYFFLFSSIGTETRLQKRESFEIPFCCSVSWWEKSYAEKIRAGANFVEFVYTLNVQVPVLNNTFNNQSAFFEYNGLKYNSSGQLLSAIPISASGFGFNVNNQNNVIDISILGANIALDNNDINTAVETALNLAINMHPVYGIRQELILKKTAGTLQVRLVYAVPSRSQVKFYIAKQNWESNNDNSIVHYFDYNFLLSYNSANVYNFNSSQNIQSFAQALSGATRYTNVKADVYGAALHNNFWKGRRLISIE